MLQHALLVLERGELIPHERRATARPGRSVRLGAGGVGDMGQLVTEQPEPGRTVRVEFAGPEQDAAAEGLRRRR